MPSERAQYNPPRPLDTLKLGSICYWTCTCVSGFLFVKEYTVYRNRVRRTDISSSFPSSRCQHPPGEAEKNTPAFFFLLPASVHLFDHNFAPVH